MVSTMTELSDQRANWKVADFDYLVVNNNAQGVHAIDVDAYGAVSPGKAISNVSLSEVHKKDKEKIQNYGGGTDGEKPSLEYIDQPRKPLIGEGGFIVWPGVASDWTGNEIRFRMLRFLEWFLFYDCDFVFSLGAVRKVIHIRRIENVFIDNI